MNGERRIAVALASVWSLSVRGSHLHWLRLRLNVITVSAVWYVSVMMADLLADGWTPPFRRFEQLCNPLKEANDVSRSHVATHWKSADVEKRSD